MPTNICAAPTVPELWEEISPAFLSEKEEEPVPDYETYTMNSNSFPVHVVSPPSDSEVDRAREQIVAVHGRLVSIEVLQTVKSEAIIWEITENRYGPFRSRTDGHLFVPDSSHLPDSYRAWLLAH